MRGATHSPAPTSARPTLARTALGLGSALLVYAVLHGVVAGVDAYRSPRLAGYAVAAALVFFFASRLARLRRDGFAATSIGVAVGIVVAGVALRSQPWAGQLIACAVGAVVARGLWGERELRRQLDASEQTARQKQAMLDHALRVSTMGDLAGMIAHRMRNRLHVMGAQASLGLGDDSTTAVQKRLSSIGEEVSEASQLVNQLLDLTHPAAADVCVLDLDRTIAEFGQRMAPLLPSVIRLHAVRPGRTLCVRAAPQDLEHALLNLVINARDAMADGGDLTVVVGREKGRAIIEVRDSGIGIRPEQLKQVFHPYYTSKPQGQGTGLGLPAVKRFVESLGGELRVQSTHGVGSAFRLLLPLAAEPVRPTGAAS